MKDPVSFCFVAQAGTMRQPSIQRHRGDAWAVHEAQGWDLLDALQHSWFPDADSGGLLHRVHQEAPGLRTWGDGRGAVGQLGYRAGPQLSQPYSEL